MLDINSLTEEDYNKYLDLEISVINTGLDHFKLYLESCAEFDSIYKNSQYKVLNTFFEDLPLLINDERIEARKLTSWRLTIKK